MELELLAVADDRVAGVVAALEADDHVGVVGEQVDDLALPLIAPLGSDYDQAWHDRGIVTVYAAKRFAEAAVGAERGADLCVVTGLGSCVAAHLDQARDGPLADLLLELRHAGGWS